MRFPTGGIVRDEPKRLSIRRNSETDSIVWMEEDGKDFCYAFTAPKDMFFGCRFLSPSVMPWGGELLPSRLRRATSLEEGGIFSGSLMLCTEKSSLFEEAVSEAD